MSEEAEEEVAAVDTSCCASCGTAEVDDIKLKKCDGGCDLVKYCSDGCQENHTEKHEEACKKRVDELRDRDLLKQPDISHLGECPICCLPLPIDKAKYVIMTCCSKYICNGCDHANQNREIEAGLQQRCAFCREPLIESLDEEIQKRLMKRVKKNDPVAMWKLGNKHRREGDYDGAFEYWMKASGWGNAEAHYNLSIMYDKGQGVEKDTKKNIYHLEQAAIGGHPDARYNLGAYDLSNGRYERARKHFIIAANLGDHDSLKWLKELYANGHASKEDYADALRAYQAAVDATKSPEREKAKEYYEAFAKMQLDKGREKL